MLCCFSGRAVGGDLGPPGRDPPILPLPRHPLQLHAQVRLRQGNQSGPLPAQIPLKSCMKRVKHLSAHPGHRDKGRLKHANTHTCMHTYTHTHTHARTHARTHTHTHTHTPTHTHTHTTSYHTTHTYTHTHRRACTIAHTYTMRGVQYRTKFYYEN